MASPARPTQSSATFTSGWPANSAPVTAKALAPSTSRILRYHNGATPPPLPPWRSISASRPTSFASLARFGGVSA
jgi:hypothetical protein